MRAHTNPLAAGAAVLQETGGQSRPAGLVGPNAIIQTAAAMRENASEEVCASIFTDAQLDIYLHAVPDHMVSEREAARLFQSVLRAFSPTDARTILTNAGLKTGDYILAHRIPDFAKCLIGFMPAPVAARTLLSAIGKHAWTFAGTGQVTLALGRELEIGIAGNPLATPGCPWHLAVFQRLFTSLVSRTIRLEHVSCCANGARTCLTTIGTGKS